MKQILYAVLGLMAAVGSFAQDGKVKIVVHAFEAESCPISAEVRPLRQEMAGRLSGVTWVVHQAPMFPLDDRKKGVQEALPFIREYGIKNVPYYIVEYEGRIVYRGMQFGVPVGTDGKKKGDLHSYITQMKGKGDPIPNRLEEVIQGLLQGKVPKEPVVVDERGCGIPEKFRKPPAAP